MPSVASPCSGRPRLAVVIASSVLLAFLSGCASQPSVPPETHAGPGTQATAPACPTICPANQSCQPNPPPPPPPPAKPIQAARWSDLPDWPGEDLPAAWPAFLTSCRKLDDQALWRQTCADAKALTAEQAGDVAVLKAFFESHLTPWRLVNADGSREGLITGYYEPLLKGDLKKTRKARYPLYAPPDDLLTIDFGDLFPDLKHMRLRGRIEGRKVVPYWTRAELDERQDKMKDKVLIWVDDAIEAFFLEIQGSGRVELPDGKRVRLGYADQNGQPYHSIGRWLLDRGELKPGQASMQGIKAWASTHPERLRELLDTNPSYVFFRILPNADGGPIGALGQPLTPGRSLAMDPRHIPLGVPVFLQTTWPNDTKPLTRLMLAQDTGGAIRGVVRADFFWGFGPEAGALAGRMRQQGTMWILMPAGYAPN